MMKKMKISVLLSLLLCALALLISCGSDEVVDDQGGNDLSDVPPAVDKMEVSEMVSGVSGFLGYIGKDNNEALSNSTSLFDEANSESLYADLGRFVVVKSSSVTVDMLGNPDTVTDMYKVKSVVSGKTLYSYIVPTYSFGATPRVELGFELYGGVVAEVAITESIISIAPDDSAYVSGYKTTYEYYDTNGVKLAGVPEDRRATITDFGYLGDFLLTVNGRAYVIRGDEIIYDFVEGVERVLPVIYHESRGYKYIVNSIEDEVFVQILDLNYICVSEYQIPARVIAGLNMTATEIADNFVYVLGNGNLLIHCTYKVDEGEEFDYYVGKERYGVYTAIFDVMSGAVTELDAGYVIKDFYSCESENAVCALTAEHNLATIATFDKETLSEVKSLVVLDNQAKVIATIPEMLPTQTTDIDSIKFIDETKFIFTTNVKGKPFVYLIDCKTQQMTLISNDAVYMDGYFYTDRAIYSNSLEALHRLSDREEIIGEVGNGLVIRDRNEYKIFTVGAFGRAIFTKVADAAKGEGVEFFGEDYVVVRATALDASTVYYVYNARGEAILTSDDLPEINEFGKGIYCAVISDNVTDALTGITKTYKKAYVLSCK